MNCYRKIDKNGLFIEDVINPIIEEGREHLYVSEPVPQGFYHPKWNGIKWVEGLSQKEIDELTSSRPQAPTVYERIDFLEQAIIFLSME